MGQRKITVLAAGTWGITLACLLHRNGHQVGVWEFDGAVVEELTTKRRHPRLPYLEIPTAIQLTTDMPRALEGSDAIVSVVPAAHLRQTCRAVAQAGYAGQLFIVCSKGIEQGTHALPAAIVKEELGAPSLGRVGLLSGPSHAEEVSRNLPTAVTAAAEDLAVAEEIREMFMAPFFRVYTQTDVLGVELAAALKNVIAISCGISDGLGFGDNSKAGLITRGLSEILRLGVALGAQAETFMGLAGVGDLVVTCMSPHSRNWRFGSLLGAGASAEEALREVGMVVEGYHTVRAAVELARQAGIEMPIAETVAEVAFNGRKAADAVIALMSRDPKSEMEG